MIVFEINSVSYGSTGRIMFQIADAVEKDGGVAYTSSSYTKYRGEIWPQRYYRIGSALDKLIHIFMAKITGRQGCFSKGATKELISVIKQSAPDIIHLHNIHGWYINWEILFDFLKESKIPVVWTLHDCWTFTGHCPHFLSINCEKWKTKCYDCPLYKLYPGCYIDDSEFQYELKKKCFTGLDNITIVTPSKWLLNMAKQSFLQDYNAVVIHNGINLLDFKPKNSNFRKHNGINNKTIILGVAFDWTVKKGLHYFLRLSQDLDETYAVVLVGVSPTVKKQLPKNIIAITCTQSVDELANIYSSADLFVNPTLEDNFPTVNLEALACGTPVITYETGGSPESITNECGRVVPYGDYEALKKAIVEMKDSKKKMTKKCIERASLYGIDKSYEQYIELYKDVISSK